MSGPSGTGKTHLCIAIAYRAIQHGYEARFVSADTLIGRLSHAAAKGRRLEGALEPFLHPHVLVIDELGYLSHATDAANVLYRVVNERYLKHRPMLLTTNKPLAALGDVLHDGDLAAILDRLLERGAHFALRGRSYRTRHLSAEESPPGARNPPNGPQPTSARIKRNSTTEFREPTTSCTWCNALLMLIPFRHYTPPL